MEEIRASSDHYRSSSSSASSPPSRVPSSFIFVRKPASFRQPISFEDSPEWDDGEIDQPEETTDSINIVTASPSLSKMNSGSIQSPPLQDNAIVPRKVAGASLVWKDLTVTEKGKRKYSDQVVKSSTGYALPGTLTVIMGPAKSGKSTLLRAIAGRLPRSAKVYGEVLVNGFKTRLQYGTYGYVEREDALIGSLTVREMLYYYALLQLPALFSQKANLVEEAISAMSLGDYADKLIGGHCYMKRLAKGERRRVSIARELVMRPHVLFIDEPLYHLDSVSALLMMVTLKKLASSGCTILFSMYQSSTEVFGLFDRICLLSNGNTLFFGETLACLQHFSNAGFPCPIMQSPSDHFLRAINTDFDRIIAMCKTWQDDYGEFSSVNMDTAVAIRTLEATYKTSNDAAAVETMIIKLTEKEGPPLKSNGQASSFTQIAVLTWRSLLVMSREWNYFWLRLLLCLLLMICIGTIFSRLGHSLSSISVRVAAVFVFVSFTSLVSIAGVPAQINEVKVREELDLSLQRVFLYVIGEAAFSVHLHLLIGSNKISIKIHIYEQSCEHSATGAFVIGNLLSSIPFLFLISVSSSLIFYFLVGMRNEFGLFMYFVLNFFMALLVNEGLMMVIAYIWLEPLKAILTLLCAQVVMMLVAGYFRLKSQLHEPVWKYPLSYVAFHTYSVQGLLENEYSGTSFAVGQVRTIPSVQALRGSYPISSLNAKWENLLFLFVMAVAYRIILYILLRLRLRERIVACKFHVPHSIIKKTR